MEIMKKALENIFYVAGTCGRNKISIISPYCNSSTRQAQKVLQQWVEYNYREIIKSYSTRKLPF